MLVPESSRSTIPFTKGHGALLQYCRERGASHVVAVMSGNFVQRGEPALLNKHARAEMAVRNGVDLVIELPVYWALSGAENFALGAVSLLNAAGCQRLCFGSECGDAVLLRRRQPPFAAGFYSPKPVSG